MQVISIHPNNFTTPFMNPSKMIHRDVKMLPNNFSVPKPVKVEDTYKGITKRTFPKDLQSFTEYKQCEDKKGKYMGIGKTLHWFIESDKGVLTEKKVK